MVVWDDTRLHFANHFASLASWWWYHNGSKLVHEQISLDYMHSYRLQFIAAPNMEASLHIIFCKGKSQLFFAKGNFNSGMTAHVRCMTQTRRKKAASPVNHYPWHNMKLDYRQKAQDTYECDVRPILSCLKHMARTVTIRGCSGTKPLVVCNEIRITVDYKQKNYLRSAGTEIY